MKYGPAKQVLGVPLVPKPTKCDLCGGKLLLRGDRPCRLTLYTESLGTVPATHFHKYCHNYRKLCAFVQYKVMYFNSTICPGILGGMWPCGIITLVREIFLAESKSQVYAHLHDFLQGAPETSSRLSKNCDFALQLHN